MAEAECGSEQVITANWHKDPSHSCSVDRHVQAETLMWKNLFKPPERLNMINFFNKLLFVVAPSICCSLTSVV